MNVPDKKQRISLFFLFVVVVFILMTLIMATVFFTTVFLMSKGILLPEMEVTGVRVLVFNMALLSVLIGTAVSVSVSVLLLKPINKTVDALNRLSSGKFNTRLSFGIIFRRNYTAQKVEGSFNRLAKQLEETEVLRSDFIDNFSHEFKTPIVSVAGFAKLIKRGNLTPSQQQEYLNIIEHESLRLADMATNVLNLTKIENRTILTDEKRFDISEQIRMCILLLTYKWEAKNISLDVDFDEYYFYGSEELLKEVWINLLDNAIKFSPVGATVSVAITETETSLLVMFTNEGDPIPSEKRSRIFDKFYQADESHATQGNGVGLAIVKKAVELHDGSVNLSCGGGKVMFTVALPRTEY